MNGFVILGQERWNIYNLEHKYSAHTETKTILYWLNWKLICGPVIVEWRIYELIILDQKQ